MTDVTRILSQIESGAPDAATQLLPLVYAELRKLAAAKLSVENSGQSLQATELVHDAYIRLVDVKSTQHWNSRGHFFGAAAEAMRRIIIENARHRGRLKHGAGLKRVELDSACCVEETSTVDLLALDEAITALTAMDPRKAEIVKLRFFAGLTMSQAAATMGISLATAERYWTFSKAWLYSELADTTSG